MTSAGTDAISLAQPAFYILVGLLVLFAFMLVLIWRRYPRRKRAIEGYLEAAGIDLAFLGFAVILVVGLAWSAPTGNRSAFALDRVILGGYWLTFSIPIVTVGSSVHSRSRGGVPWLLPSLVIAILLFVGLFAYYYANA